MMCLAHFTLCLIIFLIPGVYFKVYVKTGGTVVKYIYV